MFQKDARRLAIVALLLASPAAAQDARSTLRLTAPITRWDEAVPIGNGLLGGLLWGEGSALNLSLDRGDLWDERLPEIYRTPIWNWTTMQRLVAQDSMPRFHQLFDDPYEQIPYPTKLPGGRLVLTRSIGGAVQEFQLRLHEAEALVLYGRDTVAAVVLADRRVLLLRVPGTVDMALVPPAGVAKLGYPSAERRVNGFTQRGVDGFAYTVEARTRVVDGVTLVAVTIATSAEGSDVEAIARARLDAALQDGWTMSVQRHRAWWQEHWAISGVTLPDSALQQQYDLVHYFYGAAARRGAPPMPLQGVWTADAGGLPPWKGDYHNDLNTQMTYLAAHAAGVDDAMLGWLDHLEARLPVFRQFAREFYDAPGAVIPGVMTLAGKPMAGWGMYALSPTNGAWVAHSFYLHWKRSGDKTFLRARAYPFMQEIGTALGALLRQGRDGVWRLPLSSSPEIHDNSRRAFLTPNSSYDHALLHALFRQLEEMADTLGQTTESRKWRQLQTQLGPLVPEGVTGSLPFAAGEEYAASHRHFSHAMAIHPLGLLEARGDDSALVRATVDTIAAYGTRQWTGYSFSWFAAMLARTGRGDEALRYLKDYLAFTLRNGFHANGDQSGRGLSAMTYRPFTLEGNFLAMHAVHELLMQQVDGAVVVFPATPAVWRDVAFRDLRAEGGWRVSAWRSGGVVDSVRIVAGPGGVLRMRDPFGGAAVRWSGDEVRRDGGSWVTTLSRGKEVVGRTGGTGR